MSQSKAVPEICVEEGNYGNCRVRKLGSSFRKKGSIRKSSTEKVKGYQGWNRGENNYVKRVRLKNKEGEYKKTREKKVIPTREVNNI